ncbi:hypothetical protein SAMN05444145_10738 [Alistipes timonensis JC136]|uniref:Uncharacterized protein n=1 Tax=Alistipes timonensis JC136 TaxID=1033731 RepID=A0A1H4EDU6_9BACT|nr:hypothetical protein [Alistipes timonensis]SEA82997.1 hypothetical protein SAMN05444145_10738 [Alistipes timonensis JC136]
MDQSLFGDSVPRKAGTRQTVAAVLFALYLIWDILSVTGVLYLMLQDAMLTSPVTRFVMPAIELLLPMAGFALLIPGAANRATKTATVLLSVGYGCTVLCFAGCALSLSAASGEVMYMQIEQMNAYCRWVSLACAVVSFFAFSVILRGNAIEPDTASWIGLLLLEAMIGAVRSLFNVVGTVEPEEHPFVSFPGKVFLVVCIVLLIVAYVRLARCTAFSGAGTDAPQGVYSPLNKYMAGIVVASGVTLAALWAVYRFAAPWLRTL